MNEVRRPYREDDYLYASARVRALEAKLLGSERCARLAEAKDMTEVSRTLEEMSRGAKNADAILSEMLSDCFALVDEMTSGEQAFDIWRYPYDCHNIKSIIKCQIRGRDPIHMLYTFAAIDPHSAIDALREQKLDIFPPNMAAAIPQAQDAYAQTHNPQLIDTILDSACYADMLSQAKDSKIEIFERLVKAKIDVTNILTSLRLSRMKSAAVDERYLEQMIIGGGEIPLQTLKYALVGEDELYSRLRVTKYGALAQRLSADMSLSALERECDNFYMEFFSNVRYKVAGAEVIAAYIAAVEYQAKNLRIIIAGKKAALPSAVIRERLRSSYV